MRQPYRRRSFEKEPVRKRSGPFGTGEDCRPAIIEAFYPGQKGGNASADILFGEVNPSGKLPVTLMYRWKVSLKAGESKKVTFRINKNDLSYYDEAAQVWVAEPGQFQALVGSSSRDIRLQQSFVLAKL